MQSCQGSRAYWQQVTACKISQSFGEKKGKTGFFLGNPWCCDLVDGEDSGVTCLVSLDLLRSWSSMHPRAWARLTSQLGQNWVPRVHESPLALENRLLQLCCNPGTCPFLFFYLLSFLWIFSPCSPVVSRLLLGRALLLASSMCRVFLYWLLNLIHTSQRALLWLLLSLFVVFGHRNN